MTEDDTARDARQVAEMDVDVGRQHVGAVYAEAFLGAAANANAAEAMLDVFDCLVTDVLDRFPEFDEILASRLISHDEKEGMLDRVFAPRVPALLLDFLKVVSRHERLDCLRAIHGQAHRLYDRMCNRVRVRITTPNPLDDASAERITKNLHGLHGLRGGEPVLDREVDPELIGGAVLRIGDTVYDGSIATSLERIRQQMIDRSVHEIQSRRNRFRNPAGN